MVTDVQAIVLAAGKSTRFNTGNTKLTEKVCGQEILLYPLSVLKELEIPTTVVVGFQKQKIQSMVQKADEAVTFLEQHEINGTAGCLQLIESRFTAPNILVMKGDIPLVTSEIITQLITTHTEKKAAVSFVSCHNGDPTGFTYSRVIKDGENIRLHKAHTLSMEEKQKHCCVSAGVYLLSHDFLQKEMVHLTKDETTHEFHITDLVNIATDRGYTVAMTTAPFDQVRGVNTHQELWAIEQIKRSELIKYWMDRGVRFSSAQTVQMDLDVEIGAGSLIGCGTHLLAGTKIGSQCTVGPFTIIDNSTIGDKTNVKSHSILTNAKIGSHSQIGPFAHIQHDSIIGDNCTLGNFVETKRMSMQSDSKAKHLSYLADAQIGANVNIGAGTITCNYDGSKKNQTTIEDNVFVGTNNALIAPVTIKKDAYTAAGSAITQDVPSGALAIGRSRQVNKENYSPKESDNDAKKHDTKTNESISFIGAYKTNNDAPTTDQ